ncbi:MAG: hypothetical protein LBH92_07790 [Bacteroidales bacterium]|jgi:hypothetical protein|nr:hypothetical protein [Bacteroidales bacterium]
MKSNFLSFSRPLLLAVIFMQGAIIQAQKEYQKQINNISDSITTDTIQLDKISLSQFKAMNSRELDNFLEQNDKQFSIKYHSGRTFSQIGLTAIAPGVIVTCIGVGIITHTDHYRMRSFGILGSQKVITWGYLGGLYITAVGGVATIISTTFVLIGTRLKNQSKKEYINKHYFNNASSVKLTLNIGYTGNGIGLLINF